VPHDAESSSAPRSRRWLPYALLTIAAGFAASGVAIPALTSRIDASIARAARYEITFNVIQGKVNVAAFDAAAERYRSEPNAASRQALTIAYAVFKGWAADLKRGELGAYVRSDASYAADVNAIERAVDDLAPLVESAEQADAVRKIEAIVNAVHQPLAGVASQVLAHSVAQSSADMSELRQQQFDEFLLTSGLLVSAFGLIAFLWRQNQVVERLHRRQIAAANQFEFLASHDPLTCMPNRSAFSQALANAFARRDATGDEVALLTLDLDNFKTINDVLGHAAGDQLLISVADRLRRVAAMQTAVTAARLGGDEFSILVEGEGAERRATQIAQDTLRALQTPHQLGLLSISTNASVGLAIAPRHGAAASDIVRGSDIALNRAKSSGRGALNVFDNALDHEAWGWRALESDLAEAIECNEFEPFYQPQIDFATGTIVAVEALIRWRRDGALVPPIQFIKLAEETGLIVSIDRMMLGMVCRDALRMPESIKVAVNLSAAHFLCDDIVASVARPLAESGLAPDRLELEITESMLLTNETRTHDVLGRLRGLGASIALDDFGTGYSSLAYLRRFSFDKLKIDKAFIDDVDTHSQSFEILRAITALGRTMDMTIIAEGVERMEQARLAQLAGCRLGQGYYFARPMPIRDLLALLRRDAQRTPLAQSA
jgi:diguanylate cyclase (GGDEF)-like protein